VKKKFALYILSLLAGKFEEICTAFPLTTFSAKNSKWLPFRFFAKSYVNIFSCKKQINEKPISFLLRKKVKEQLFLIPKYIQEIKFGIKYYPPKHFKFSMFARDEVYRIQQNQHGKFYSKQ